VEKRRFTRVPYKLEAMLIQGKDRLPVIIKNISIKGVFLAVKGIFEAGQPVVLEFKGYHPEGEELVEISGTVKHLDIDGIGMKFDSMDLETFDIIKNIVSYQIGDADKILDELYKSL